MDKCEIENELVIALCDDSKSAHDIVKKLLFEYKKNAKFRLTDIYFFSSEELISYDGNIDILLLDIDMPGTDGIEAGCILREASNKCRIIMFSAYEKRFKETYKIGVFRFVSKPVDRRELFDALDDVLITFLGYKEINVRHLNTNCKILQCNIDYFESAKDFVKVYSGERRYDANRTLKSIEAELDNRLFVRTGKSFIINLSKVKEIKKKSVILFTGAEVAISRREYKNFIERYNDFDAKGYIRIKNGFIN